MWNHRDWPADIHKKKHANMVIFSHVWLRKWCEKWENIRSFWLSSSTKVWKNILRFHPQINFKILMLLSSRIIFFKLILFAQSSCRGMVELAKQDWCSRMASEIFSVLLVLCIFLQHNIIKPKGCSRDTELRWVIYRLLTTEL